MPKNQKRSRTMSKDLVVKSNQLIVASYTLSLVEQRLILMAIVTARESALPITSDTLLKVRAEDYMQHFNVTRQTAYQALAEAAESLFNRRVTVEVYDPDRQQYRPLTVRWVTGMSYEPGQALITLRFGPEVIPHITRLEANFTMYELKQVAALKSGYAVRLYEMLIKWRVSGKTPEMPLQEFREQLGLLTGQYERMADFKKNVLDLAVSQINQHTDIDVVYEQLRQGRTISAFIFRFTVKAPSQPVQVVDVVMDEAPLSLPAPVARQPGFAGLELQLFRALKKQRPALTQKQVRAEAQAAGMSAFDWMQAQQV